MKIFRSANKFYDILHWRRNHHVILTYNILCVCVLKMKIYLVFEYIIIIILIMVCRLRNTPVNIRICAVWEMMVGGGAATRLQTSAMLCTFEALFDDIILLYSIWSSERKMAWKSFLQKFFRKKTRRPYKVL